MNNPEEWTDTDANDGLPDEAESDDDEDEELSVLRGQATQHQNHLRVSYRVLQERVPACGG